MHFLKPETRSLQPDPRTSRLSTLSGSSSLRPRVRCALRACTRWHSSLAGPLTLGSGLQAPGKAVMHFLKPEA